jgi:hypothetical protein
VFGGLSAQPAASSVKRIARSLMEDTCRKAAPPKKQTFFGSFFQKRTASLYLLFFTKRR